MDSTSGICEEPPSTTPLKLLVKDIGAVYVLSEPLLLGSIGKSRPMSPYMRCLCTCNADKTPHCPPKVCDFPSKFIGTLVGFATSSP